MQDSSAENPGRCLLKVAARSSGKASTSKIISSHMPLSAHHVPPAQPMNEVSRVLAIITKPPHFNSSPVQSSSIQSSPIQFTQPNKSNIHTPFRLPHTNNKTTTPCLHTHAHPSRTPSNNTRAPPRVRRCVCSRVGVRRLLLLLLCLPKHFSCLLLPFLLGHGRAHGRGCGSGCGRTRIVVERLRLIGVRW